MTGPGRHSIVINGTGLTGPIAITADSYEVISDTQVSAVFTFPTPLVYSVTVTTVGGTSNGLPFTYQPSQ